MHLLKLTLLSSLRVLGDNLMAMMVEHVCVSTLICMQGRKDITVIDCKILLAPPNQLRLSLSSKPHYDF